MVEVRIEIFTLPPGLVVMGCWCGGVPVLQAKDVGLAYYCPKCACIFPEIRAWTAVDAAMKWNALMIHRATGDEVKWRGF